MSRLDLLPILSAIALYPACWRLAYMLTAEKGPANIFSRLRAKTDLWGVLKCHACTSMWTALLFVALWASGWGQWVVLVFGVSGLAVLRGNYLFGEVTGDG